MTYSSFNHTTKNNNDIHNKEEWLIVGAGAVGFLWYSKLHEQGYNPTILHRNNTSLQTLTIKEKSSCETIPLKSITAKVLQHKGLNQFTHILFCTKSFDLVAAYKEISPFLPKYAHILCLCNGMGPQQELLKLLPQEQPLFIGVTSEGVLKSDIDQIMKTGKGDTFFGQLTKTTHTPSPFIASLLVDDIFEKLIAKLAVNAAINPLTALFNIRNGELLSERYQTLFLNCCSEISSFLMRAKLSSQPHLELIRSVALATQENRSSMLQDIDHNRKTEIDSISGYLLQLAQKEGASLPIQELLVDALTGEINQEKARKALLAR